MSKINKDILKGRLALLFGCLALFVISIGIVLMPYIATLIIFKDPLNKPTQAKPPQAKSQTSPNELNSDIQFKTQNPPLLPPDIRRMQDLEGPDASARILQKIEALKNSEIKLWGAVVDELGNRLPSVQVVWTLGYVPSDQPNRGSVFSNNNGEFFVGGMTSSTIHLTGYKQGYTAHPESTGTWFSDVPCSKESPLKLVMHKE